MELKDLVNKVNEYNAEEVDRVIKAYHYADALHGNQTRESGEKYITHPLNVAYILASELHVDGDTLCASLLHDTLEDTKATKEDIAHEFNPTVASLVDQVTKISQINFSTKEAQNLANIRKILMGIGVDPRGIMIKLGDRTHNMRTLGSKKKVEKRIENARETMDIYVPISRYLGLDCFKTELEDLSLQYLKPDSYKKISDQRAKIEAESQDLLNEMLFKIKRLLDDRGIPNELKVRIKNIYEIYKKIDSGENLYNIHNLLAIKVLVDEVNNCYSAFGIVHQAYNPIPNKFKDYICNPKTNMYRSLHTTVFGPGGRLVQAQIRTFEMEKINTIGLAAYWDAEKGNARNAMLADLKEKFQFFRSLKEIDEMFPDNHQFVTQVKNELFSERVYVNTLNGYVYELPKGSTIIDLAFRINPDLASTLVGAFVNDQLVPIDYILKCQDRVRLLMDDFSFGSHKDWFDKAYTSYAKRKILEFNSK